MTEISIQTAGPGDEVALAAMIDALDTDYGDPVRPAAETRAAVADWLRGARNDTRFTLAFAESEPVGLACFVLLQPGNALAGQLFLKDLYVAADWRGRGVGQALMRFLAQFCLDQGIGRIDWVLETDEAARFYDRLGARPLPHKRFMRLDGSALKELADK